MRSVSLIKNFLTRTLARLPCKVTDLACLCLRLFQQSPQTGVHCIQFELRLQRPMFPLLTAQILI